MVRYQQADEIATRSLIEQLSPQLYRFFAAQLGNPDDASDMLQDAWLRIHRKRRRIAVREILVEVLPEPPVASVEPTELPPFDQLIAPLPASQREVLTM